MRCSIAFSLDVHWDWPKLCTVTELGHLNGKAHVDDDSDLMAAYYYFDATPECSKAPMPGASSAGAKASTSRTSGAQTRKARDRATRAR